MNNKNIITTKVNEFYNEMPFNYSESAQNFASNLQRYNPIEKNYPNAHEVLDVAERKSLADVGCGTGWFSNCVAYYYKLNVTAIDICSHALNRAFDVSKALGVQEKVIFVRSDIFSLNANKMYYFVNSLGVLHHTYDCKGALKIICSMVENGGYIHIGLYHKYGREPFLCLFKELRDKIVGGLEIAEGEISDAFKIFKELNKNMSDETLLYSWFRDQVLHPHETLHTFKELQEWLTNMNFKVMSTSINNFNPISDISNLCIEERKFYDISVEKNIRQSVYFPGFFTVLAKKEE
ncbi:MAG: class I SAM-dependent methyltransferase [Deltaproteobacteria bacterium]|nr:class I SAM-dependent methyltransferase [Deltaproteobacteria bacterium]